MASPTMHRYLPFSASTTPLQATTYLLGIALFSISFLVFLNSSVSFVITDLIGARDHVGDTVGTLGFVDELVALVACPAWGLLSDRLGVRAVAVAGYLVIGLSLVLFVQASAVYPWLVLARILFAVGATAAATMVTAILPTLTDESDDDGGGSGDRPDAVPKPSGNPRDSVALSVESELTITPERYARSISRDTFAQGLEGPEGAPDGSGKPSALAGYVGLFTGCGALLALLLFLPLPAKFGERDGVTLAQAVKYSYYVVGLVAIFVAGFVSVGLRGLKGEEGKGWRVLFGLKDGHGSDCDPSHDAEAKQIFLPYRRLLKDSVLLGFSDAQIGLGYLGGFVARASTVAISLFIPLFVNSFFINNGFCQGSPNDPSPELKKECRSAYILASILTGVAQLMGLICAPLFGYLSSKSRGVNVPIIVATAFGIIGYIIFPQLQSPEPKDVNGRGGSPVIFLVVALIGISQIGAIVCSLGLLGKGVLRVDLPRITVTEPSVEEQDTETATEAAPLLATTVPIQTVSRVRLKGSIAGVYSWCGGAAILLLTKLGGYLFDAWTPGAPFYMMAIFNAILLVASLGVDAGRAFRSRS